MHIIGIDPAPTKGLHVFDGKDKHTPLERARSSLTSLLNDDVLVCWDAPLTGPPLIVVDGNEASGSAFSQRPIESFLSRAYTGFKTLPGISIRGYSGCPHWALSRSLVGLPRVGPFDAVDASLPFHLVADNTPPTYGRYIVEVHPAVAIWLWCRQQRTKDANWEYKKSITILQELWEILFSMQCFNEVFTASPIPPPTSDDMFDARVAYALGWLWVNRSNEVILLGNANSGALLLPNVEGMEDAFHNFLKRAE